MKKVLKYSLTLLFALFVVSFSLTAQTKEVEKVNKKVDKAEQKADKAEQKADKAEQKLDVTKDQAEETYESEWKEFKRDVQNKIDNNDKKIRELRKHQTSDPSEQSNFNKKIDKLEAENEQLKKDLKDYDYNGKDDWQKFKNSFNKRLDKLGDDLDVATD